MADNVVIDLGTSSNTTSIACDQVSDGTLGTVQVQFVKIMDGTLDGTSKAAVGANGLKVDASGAVVSVAGTISVGSVSQASAPWLFNVVDGTTSTTKAAVSSAAPGSTANAQVVSFFAANILDIGSGTGSTKTIRTIIDSSQLAALATAVQSVAGGVQMVALPTDQQPIPAANVTDRMFNGVTSITPTFAQATTSLSGNTEIVASTSGKKIRVLNAALFGNGAVNAKWQSSTSDISPLAPVGSNFGYVLPFSPVGWFETASNAGLRLNLSVSQINVGVHIAYVLI